MNVTGGKRAGKKSTDRFFVALRAAGLQMPHVGLSAALQPNDSLALTSRFEPEAQLSFATLGGATGFLFRLVWKQGKE